jgi:4-hydroxyphenylpyruvate dioxygenase-like putative hemolysin
MITSIHTLIYSDDAQATRQHSIAIMCDDIDATVDELRAKGAQFRGAIEEREYGRVIMMIVPGADDMQLYQPTHKLAYNL